MYEAYARSRRIIPYIAGEIGVPVYGKHAEIISHLRLERVVRVVCSVMEIRRPVVEPIIRYRYAEPADAIPQRKVELFRI